MSRHVLTPRDPAHAVTVGYDGPMRTFLAQVFRRDSGREILWLGQQEGEIAEPEALAASLAPYAEVTPALLTQLRADRDTAPPPIELQRGLLALTAPRRDPPR